MKKALLILSVLALMVMAPVPAMAIRRATETDGTDAFLFEDDQNLILGTGRDVKFDWDGTSFIMASTAAASPFLIGAAGFVFNITHFGDYDITGDVAITGALSATSFTGLVIGTDVQAYDADLTTWATISPSANVQSFSAAADYAAMKVLLDLEIGTDVQAYDADLDTWAALTPTANAQTLVESTNFLSMTQDLSVEIGVDAQAYDADLDTWATLTPTANAQTLVESTNFLSMTQDLSVEIGVDAQAYDADLDTYATITPTAASQITLEHAADAVLMSQHHRMTVAEINAGHSLLPAISGQSYRVVECIAIAYGGAVGTTTTVDLLGTQSAGGVKIITYAQADLTQSSVLTGTDDGTVLADGASFSPMDATTAITVGVTGAAADTATGIDFIITYVIE